MFTIGCHLSASKGYLAMAKEAVNIKANTFQYFSRNPRGGRARDIDREDINNFLKFSKQNGIHTILAHAPYTLNACSDKEHIRKFAYNTIVDDLATLELLPNNFYNFHPGSHVGQGEEIGIKFISEMLNKAIKKEQTTIILLETMSGKGSEIGKNFEQLREIINSVNLNKKVGVCLDTCHVFDGGYDIINDIDGVLSEFDKVIGLEKLKAIHLNGSKNTLGSHKDRHAKLGEGNINLEAISNIINHKKLKDLPFYLETPNDINGYKKEIELLKSIYKN